MNAQLPPRTIDHATAVWGPRWHPVFVICKERVRREWTGNAGVQRTEPDSTPFRPVRAKHHPSPVRGYGRIGVIRCIADRVRQRTCIAPSTETDHN